MSLGRWRVCAEPGCGELVPVGSRRCGPHTSEARRRADAKRPSAADRGYDAAWRKLAADFLAAYPWCADCGQPATTPDHDPVPRVELVRRGVPDPDAWHRLVPRCTPCHSKRTVAEDGGFGRPGRRPDRPEVPTINRPTTAPSTAVRVVAARRTR